MAGLVPAIHVCIHREAAKTWMPGTSPGMTVEVAMRCRRRRDYPRLFARIKSENRLNK